MRDREERVTVCGEGGQVRQNFRRGGEAIRWSEDAKRATGDAVAIVRRRHAR